MYILITGWEVHTGKILAQVFKPKVVYKTEEKYFLVYGPTKHGKY